MNYKAPWFVMITSDYVVADDLVSSQLPQLPDFSIRLTRREGDSAIHLNLSKPSKPFKPSEAPTLPFAPIDPIPFDEISKPIAITTSSFLFNTKSKKLQKEKLEGAIASNSKEFKQLIKQIDNGIIVNQSNNKVYLVDDGEKKVIAKNKSGDDLTEDNFSKNINFINPDKIINTVATNKNNSGSGVDINKLLNKFNEMDKTIGKLQKSNSNLRNSNKNLIEKYESDYFQDFYGDNTIEPTRDSKDPLTGLGGRLDKLEDLVKIDRDKLPSSNPKAGIGYFIHRNQEDIKSNTSQFDSVFKRFAAIESNLAGSHISDYTNFDVIAKINDLTSRLSAVEAVLAG